MQGITQLINPKQAQRPRQIAFDRSAIELSDNSLFQMRNTLCDKSDISPTNGA